VQTVDEKIFFFPGSKSRSLLGFLHKPRFSQRSTGIIFCHPFAEEKNQSHSVIVKTSRAFAEIGFPVLRFDMSGCGDSEGELGEVTLSDWQKDLTSAIEHMKKDANAKNYALWGLRLGAGLAMLHAAQDSNVSFLILWEPVLDFKKYMHHFLRRKISSQITDFQDEETNAGLTPINQLKEDGRINIIGYTITNTFYESFESASTQLINIEPKCSTLLLSISLLERPARQLKHFFDSLDLRELPVSLTHLNAEPFWDRYWRWECPEVTDYCVKWIDGL